MSQFRCTDRNRGGMTGKGERANRADAIRALQSVTGTLIYAVRMRDGVIKIGASADPVERLSHFDSSEILALRPGTREAELAIHHSLRAHIHHGREWYNPTPEVLAVVNDMRSDLGLKPLAS